MSYWSAPAYWSGETCFIVAGGPSLRGFDFQRLRFRNVIVINSSFRAVPFADFLVFGDGQWWDWCRAEVLRDFKGRIVTVSEKHDQPLWRMKKAKPPGLSPLRDSLTMENTSLTPAINLALHMEVSRIVLMGADMSRDKAGHCHHHAPHPRPVKDGCWDRQMKELQTLAKPLKLAGVAVINTSLDSRIGWWPKQPIEELL